MTICLIWKVSHPDLGSHHESSFLAEKESEFLSLTGGEEINASDRVQHIGGGDEVGVRGK